MFAAWVDRLFRINEVVYGSKRFHNKGVILTTDAVQVPVHYMKFIPPNPNVHQPKGNYQCQMKVLKDDKDWYESIEM